MPQKPILRLNFVDFWQGFSCSENYFIRLLEPLYCIQLSSEPDFLIYSIFGEEHKRFSCTKIFYTGECVRPRFEECDFAFTSDHVNHPRHYRLPLYALYGDATQLTAPNPPVKEILRNKSEFCCMVVSNPFCEERLRFFHLLSLYKKVHSGGMLLNNIGGAIPLGKKLDFIRHFKFVLCFENQSFPGYTTEKIYEAMLADCLPIYWGNPLIHLDFNTDSFVNCHTFPDFVSAARNIIALNENDDLYMRAIAQPWFTDNRINSFVDQRNVAAQFQFIFSLAWRS